MKCVRGTIRIAKDGSMSATQRKKQKSADETQLCLDNTRQSLEKLNQLTLTYTYLQSEKQQFCHFDFRATRHWRENSNLGKFSTCLTDDEKNPLSNSELQIIICSNTIRNVKVCFINTLIDSNYNMG